MNITNIIVIDNPASFLTPFRFEISYECLIPLTEVWNGNSPMLDLRTMKVTINCWRVLVGPVKVANYRFILQENAAAAADQIRCKFREHFSD